MAFILSSSYFHLPHTSWAPWLHRLWFANVRQYTEPAPRKIYIIANDSLPVRNPLVEVIKTTGDLGHCDDLLYGRKPWFLPACPAGWLLSCWVAYMCECDLISREQDALVFGPYVRTMYEQLGYKGAIFGPSRQHGTSTSLFLVKHHHIPTFVMHYLQGGREDHIQRIAEHKIHRMIEQYPESYCRFTFTGDKDRPVDMDQKVFWMQQCKRDELIELQKRGLITLDGMPENVEHFFNSRPLPKT